MIFIELLLRFYQITNQTINILFDLKNINKHAKLILKISIIICLSLALLILTLHIGAPYAVDLMFVTSLKNDLIDTLSALFVVGVIGSLFGDLILRPKMGPETETDEETDEN